MLSSDIPVVCLMGPTATGKTDAAAQIFDELNSEIVSVDSSLVYSGMDIGTAKPNTAFLKKYPHHLVDIRHPNDTYSVADFYDECKTLIKEITSLGKVPVLAGGTMFYFSALEKGLNDLPKANLALRARLDEEAQKIGWAEMHVKLSEIDAQRAARIDPADAQRIQRALEIVMETGKPVTEQGSSTRPPLDNPMLKIALSFSDRAVLHGRIEQRFDIMLEQGLEAEVETLLSAGVSFDAPSMKMIGYRQMLEYLKGDITYHNMRSKGTAATRQLAKRQLTWLRNQSNVLWWVDFGLKEKEFRPLTGLIKQYLDKSNVIFDKSALSRL